MPFATPSRMGEAQDKTKHKMGRCHIRARTQGPAAWGPRTSRRQPGGTGLPQLVNWSGREDSNLRPPQPHCGALPDCATPRIRRNRNRPRKAAEIITDSRTLWNHAAAGNRVKQVRGMKRWPLSFIPAWYLPSPFSSGSRRADAAVLPVRVGGPKPSQTKKGMARRVSAGIQKTGNPARPAHEYKNVRFFPGEAQFRA